MNFFLEVTFTLIRTLVRMSIAQGGSGIPYLTPSVYSYIRGERIKWYSLFFFRGDSRYWWKEILQ